MFYGDWLQRRASLSPNKVAILDALHDNQPITYQGWNRRTNRLANFLRDSLGVRKGDRVSIYAMNRAEYLDALFACNKLGAILQVLNWRLTPRELASIINDAAPRVLLYSQEFMSQVDALCTQLPSVESFVGLDEVIRDRDPHWPSECETWPDSQPLPIELDWEDPWMICYTGGTTGLPKGAILHYRSVTANAVNTIVSWGLSPNDVIPEYMPFFHTGGLHVLTTPLVYLGGTNIVCASFDIDQLFDQIESMGVTFFFAVPTMFLMMIQHPRWESLDLSGVRLVMAGGGACPAIVCEAFWEKGVEFKSGYGLTEAGPNTFWLPTELMKHKVGSVGRPLFHVDVKLVDEESKSVGPEEIGHLFIRGPHVFGGYWNRPEATAETIVDGWLHTGDLARRDKDGDYYIAGRLKDMIKSGGENIYPVEVEDMMHRHPAIAEAALISVSHPKWGEVGRAVVVLKPGASLGGDELQDWLRERIAHYKVPKTVVFVDALPKTAANKVDKQKLANTQMISTADTDSIGIVSAGMYLPEPVLTAADIAAEADLPEWVVRDKLGINQKHMAGPDDHPNEMAIKAALDCLSKTGVAPEEIDVVLCTTEEWREYLLWTTAIHLAYEIGATRAWGIDLHMRCCTTVSALKLARDMMIADPEINTVLIGGGYRLGDLVNLGNPRTSFMFNIGAGAGALLLRRNWPRNHVLGSHMMVDGSMSKDILVPASGTVQFPTDEAVADGLFYSDLLEPEAMKARLNEVSMDNWMFCVDEALRKSGFAREDLGFLNMIHVKPSAYRDMLQRLGLTEEQGVYNGDYGHIGEQDSIINMIEGEKQGRLRDGDLMIIVAAGIGYVWGASCVKWGLCDA